MKRIDLIPIEHNRKLGDALEYIQPNIVEDCIFYADGKPIGFYMERMPEKMCKLADLANAEFLSKRVPKMKMNRTSAMKTQLRTEWKGNDNTAKVIQFSTILGSIPPRNFGRRPYCSKSSVHSVESAETFVKSMLLLATESEQLIKQILPDQYDEQLQLISEIDKKWRFANLFTSSISNFNISAPFHKDTGNLHGAVNVIICKKYNSKGGDLHIPDYDATIGQKDNSILVYPAWRNVHGVTPILPTFAGGYRNSLIFYALKAFKGN